LPSAPFIFFLIRHALFFGLLCTPVFLKLPHARCISPPPPFFFPMASSQFFSLFFITSPFPTPFERCYPTHVFGHSTYDLFMTTSVPRFFFCSFVPLFSILPFHTLRRPRFDLRPGFYECLGCVTSGTRTSLPHAVLPLYTPHLRPLFPTVIVAVLTENL